ncbi:hypothetical protein JNW90_08570 [Micromonospora sp. STR1s_5]|nr:hypothetical protein [Micromonospora sp. STR1s_5]
MGSPTCWPRRSARRRGDRTRPGTTANWSAGGNLFLHDEAASLNAAATATGHRGLGAQSALIAARARAAAEAGCRWLFAETGKPAPGQQNPSLNNMLRAGLVPLYERRNWVWRAAS